MMGDRGGRRIKIVIWEDMFPHSREAKKLEERKAMVIFQTDWKRPFNAFTDFMGYWAERANRAFTEPLDKKN